MTTHPYYTCDVFTSTRFGGNPLAVVLNAHTLTTQQMQHIAREFNYSETTFVLPPEHNNTNKIRIFTPTYEMPFAGHPNIGTAFTLATTGHIKTPTPTTHITFEETAGIVPITIHTTPNQPITCELKAPQPLTITQTLPTQPIATLLNLTPQDIQTQTHPPQIASVGTPFIITELKTHQTLQTLRINPTHLKQLESQGVRPSILLYTRTSNPDDTYDIHARMFTLMHTLVEDPATGSANCALAALLTHYHPERNGTFTYRISQGVEMGRPSELNARTTKQNGVVTGTWIAGTSIMVMQGTISI